MALCHVVTMENLRVERKDSMKGTQAAYNEQKSDHSVFTQQKRMENDMDYNRPTI